MIVLTERQQQVLDFVTSTQARTGVTPSTREIQVHFGFSSQTAVMNHLKALEKKGVIQRRAGKARALALSSQLDREVIVDVPIYGSIAAGMAETVEPEQTGMVSIDAATVGLRPNRRVFGLKVRGDSMIGAQINDGDLAIMEIREPRPGEIVAALIDGETTLKRFVVEKGRSFLHAENPNYPDLLPVTELVIQGVMAALIRRYRH